MLYVAIANGLDSRRKLVPITDNIYNHVNKNKDFYASLYKYNQEHFNKLKESHSLSGIKDVKTDRLIFDFDNETNIEQARLDAVEICKRLIENGVEANSIGAYFSGGKGFHVEVKTKQEFTRQEFVNIVFNLAEGLSSFDPRINDEQRIIRIPLTKHPDTNLYKIPLTLDQLTETPITLIKNMAKDLNNINVELIDNWIAIDLPEMILELKNKECKIILNDNNADIDLEKLNFDPFQLNLSHCPKWLSPERYALQEGFFYGSESVPVGERNDAFMILASTYKKNGINKNIALAMLKETAKMQAARTNEHIFPDIELEKNIINVIYSSDWNGGIYSADHPLLATIRKRFGIPEIGQVKDFTSSNEIFGSFVDYATNIDSNTIKTGLPFDDDIRLTIGMPVALLGAPSSGKTSCAINILRNTSKQNMSSIFFSMDMHKALICQKQLHLIYGHNAKTIYKNIKLDGWRKKYSKSLEEEFGNVTYFTKSGLTIEDIRYYVEKKKSEIGDNLKLVVIDYLECIRGPYSDPTTNSAIIADGIKNIAVELNVCVILLVQPPKIAGGAAYPLNNMYQIKGSSMVAQAMRSVIGIYREGFSPDSVEDDKFITFVGLKNSMGSLFKKDCHWNGLTSVVRDLDEIEKQELDNLREKVKSERRGNEF